MARQKKTRGVNRSEIIRNWIEAHPDQTPKPIIDGIKKEHGLKVSNSLVNAIKYGRKKDPAAKKTTSRSIVVAGKDSAGANGSVAKSADRPVTFVELMAAKKAAESFKNLNRMAQSIEALAELIG